MSLNTVINDIFDEKMKNLHVAYLAKVLEISGKKAKIQPLGLTRQYGGTAQKQAVITGVHIARSASSAVVGDIVLCVCCDRNIDAALRGENSLPPVGCHNKSDCVIVSVI